MVKELPITNNRNQNNWRFIARQMLLLLNVFGLVFINFSSNAFFQNKRHNRATAIIGDHSFSGGLHDENTTNISSHTGRDSAKDKSPPPPLLDKATTVALSLAEADTTTATEDRDTSMMIPVQNMSALEYRACCGVGHRLARQAAAYHAAHKLGWSLDVYWPGCRGGMNIFDELFHPATLDDLTYVNSTHERFVVRNEVPGYHNANRNCLPDELESNYQMYSSMKRRFKQRARIDSFVKEHFEGKLAIGVHIRAGNGEQGDFTNKNRGVKTTAQNYTQRVSQNIIDLVQRSNNTRPPVLFVATDTAKYVDLLRTALEGVMPVVEWDQEHEAEGQGVFAGEARQGIKPVSNDVCLQKWKDMMSDMILLASTDILIAGQYSSFSQAMPLSLVMGEDPVAGKGRDAFCEVHNEGQELMCYSNKMDWCRRTRHRNSLKTLNVKGGQWPTFLRSMYSSDQYSGPGAKKSP